MDRICRSRLPFLYDRYIFATVACLMALLAVPQGAFAWGREGHQITVIVAEHYMRPETATRTRELLAPESPEEASASTVGCLTKPHGKATVSSCGTRVGAGGTLSRASGPSQRKKVGWNPSLGCMG